MRAEQRDQMVVLPTPAAAKTATYGFTGGVWVDGITDGGGPGTPTLATVRCLAPSLAGGVVDRGEWVADVTTNAEPERSTR